MMTVAAWSWLSAVVSLIGPWISGRNPRWGWMYGLASQSVWIAYGLDTDAKGNLMLSAGYVILYWVNIRRWRHSRFDRNAADTVEAMAAKLRDAGWQVTAPEPAMGGAR